MALLLNKSMNIVQQRDKGNKMKMTFNEVKEAWFQESDLIINATESQMERLANFLDDNDYVNTVDERAIAIHEEMNYLWSLETAEEFV